MTNQTTRRQFLKYSGLAGLALGTNADFLLKKKKNVGVQLYSVRTDMQKDPKGTLKAVAGLGYKLVELAGYNGGKYYGMEPKEFKMVTKDLGLSIPSSHVSVNPTSLLQDGKVPDEYLKVMDDAAFFGQKYIVWPFIAPPLRGSMEAVKKFVTFFNNAGTEAAKRGLTFGYHNHDFEFKDLEGTNMMTVFLKETDPKNVTFELDLYWVVAGGKDPVALMKEYPGRFSLVHVKDMNKSKVESIEIGAGKIDFQNIFDNGSKAGGIKYYIVEQEAYPNGSPLESIGWCLKNLNKLKFK